MNIIQEDTKVIAEISVDEMKEAMRFAGFSEERIQKEIDNGMAQHLVEKMIDTLLSGWEEYFIGGF